MQARARADGWTVWADRGGTFTDCIGRDPEGRLHSLKLLSHAPGHYEDAVVEGTRRMLGVAPGAPFPAGTLRELRLGTTVTTNALLEGRHHPCGLICNRGFEDLLRIGDQSRPELFELAIPPRAVLYRRVAGLSLRRDASGGVLQALDEAEARQALETLRGDGLDSLAIALLHAPAAPEDEQRLARLAEAAGFATVVCSHAVSPRPGLLERTQTAVVEAALAPLLARYTQQLARQLPGARLRIMQSDGRLTAAEHLAATHSIFSGPAGGVIGARAAAREAGVEGIIGLDMGGTSTDVFQSEGEDRLPLRDAVRINRQEVRAPSLDLHTIAAGGGSRIHHDGRRLRVGPDSAGADPGPACYGRGGFATVTDANVVLGRVWAEGFAPRFGKDGRSPLDPTAAAAAIAALLPATSAKPADDAESASSSSDNDNGDGDGDGGKPPEAVAALACGALRIAVEHMAAAARRISVARGIDIRGHCLVAFGGAGPQHACDVAEALGLSRLLIPGRASLLSAAGMGTAAVGVTHERHLGRRLDAEALAEAEEMMAALREQSLAALARESVAAERVEERLLLRYAESETLLEMASAPLEVLQQRFAAAHEQRFGFADPQRPIWLEGLRCRASDHPPPLPAATPPARRRRIGQQQVMLLDGRWHELPIIADVGSQPLDGPALLLLDQSCFLVNPGWRVHATAQGLLAERHAPAQVATIDDDADPARLELFNHRFTAIASEMGEALQRSAQSVNVRNRLDYSCAVFDAEGRLVANAPHIPVHLGSMGASVRAVLARAGERLTADSAWLINDPYAGGTHLPDLTLILPVNDDRGQRRALVAARAHHADIGGIHPGSMPAGSRHIDEEGIRIESLQVLQAGRLDEALLRRVLGDGRWPARNIDANLADLRAQLAACRRGAGLLGRLMQREGAGTVGRFMRRVQDYTAGRVAEAIGALGRRSHDVALDGGQRVALRLSAGDGGLRLDFRDSSGPDPGNGNAPEAVVRAAVMYALRCWLAADVPLNDGFLDAVQLQLRHPGLLSPQAPAAVVAGNVETSQAIADAVLVSLGAVAESQGTMNNFSFGNDRHQYYETLCGGSGAGPGFAGADAVHSHMTNSRITDVEIIEARYPVRITRFSLRRGSGGQGAQRGGDGVIREWLFLQAMHLDLIGNHRRQPPRGMAGGGDAATGSNLLIHPDGREETLPGTVSRDLAAGSRVRIATPGGGGWGRA